MDSDPRATPKRPGGDRDLLFGLLALQNHFIDRDELLGAFSLWVADKSRPLGRILRDRGALDDDCYALLEGLVRQHLKRHGDTPEESLAALSAVGPVRRELEQLRDPDLHASLARLPDDRAGRDDRDATRSFAPDALASAGIRFRPLRWHASGGLGEIHIAHDEELRREVALKRIQPRYADDPQSRARFLVEAEITGRLEHPGVVPVYGLGYDPSGRPFYAMRFVKGETLRDSIAQFHRAEGPDRDPRERVLALRRLLGRFVAVCNAIAYAHSRGVIHRDLKPANVLLGPFGETLVIDWGLAKVVGHAESIADQAEATLRPALADGSSETQPGSALGTPGFMSPEQAAGRLDEVGPASDVYSLGATLYCLLTGRPPIEEKNVDRAVIRAQRGEFPPPRSLNPTIDPVLEAICLKAMAKDPVDRHPSPRELADDVELLLASDFEKLKQAHRELHEAHEALKRAKSQIVQSAKLSSIGLLAAGIAHEVNNPLAFVSSNLDVFERDSGRLRELIALYEQLEGSPEEARPDLLGRIREFREEHDTDFALENLSGILARSRDGLHRIRTIIGSLRNFARADNDEEGKEADPNAVVESALDIVRRSAYKKYLQLLADLAPIPNVRSDAAKLGQVVMNLLVNAVDACSEGGTVSIRTRVEDRGVRIEVEDDGHGIEPGILDRIFDPFFTTKPAGQGTGLGLSISQGIVREQGGRIEVASAPGRGSRFTVHLPAETETGRLSPRYGTTLDDFRHGSADRAKYDNR